MLDELVFASFGVRLTGGLLPLAIRVQALVHLLALTFALLE